MPLIKNVKELREYLDKKESEWTEEDKEFLGPFEAQDIRIPFYENSKFYGYGWPTIEYSLYTWFIFDTTRENSLENLSVHVSEEKIHPGNITSSRSLEIKEVYLEEDGVIGIKVKG